MQGILPTSAALLTIAKICQLKFVGPSITTHKQPRAITTICAFFNRPGAWNFGCEKTTQPSKQNLFCSSDYIFHLSATFDEHSNSKIYSINWLEFLLTRLFQAQQQQGTASSSAAGNIPAQLFEAIFAQALSQSNQSQAGLHLGHLDQSHLNASSDQSSPPVSTALAEDTSTVVSTPTSAAAPAGVQQADEEAAKFMAQLLRDAPASLLSQLPGQSQPTSPNLQGTQFFEYIKNGCLDASQLLEQLQFMGLLNPNTSQGGPGPDQTELKNTVANGALDLASMFGSQPSSLLNSASQLSQQQRVSD